MATQPTLGYGQRGEAPINQVNAWMRSTDWYQALIKSFGQQPNHVQLTENQKQQVIRAAQAHGVVVDEGGNGQEIDDSGNFRAKGHKLRNTLIVGGIAAAAIAAPYVLPALTGGGGAAGAGAAATAGGVEAGAVAGLSPFVASGALGLASLPALATPAATAAITAAAATIGPTAAKTAAAKVAASGGALTVENILKYALPVAGNLVGGLIQANAEGKASDAQQKYLEDALAYEKEKDAYARARESRLDTQEAQRYGDYQGRIAPWIANGITSNDRMAALLGLPARAESSNGGASGGFSSGRGAPNVDVGDAPAKFYAAMQDAGLNAVAVQGHGQQIADAVNKKYPGLGVTVDPKTDAILWPGIGSVDVTIDSGKGGFGFRPDGYVPASAVPTATSARTYAATIPTATAPAPITATRPEPPQPRTTALVQMRAPDGSVQRVPADQVDHYTQRGATLIGAVN